MLTENELRQVLDKAVSTGGDFAELYWEDKEEHNIDFSGGKPGRVTAVRTVGAGIHLMAGTKSVYVCTNDLTLPALMRADKLLKRADQAGADGTAAVAASLPGAYEDFLAAGSGAEGEKALGKLLLAVTAAAREKGLDAEMSLLAACKALTEDFAEAEENTREAPETLPEAFREAIGR